MVEILRKLRAEHDDLTKVLDVLEQEVESYRKDGSLNREILGAVLDYCRGYPALCHHPKEDLIYRKLRLAADSAAIDSVGDLITEHGALAELTDQLGAAVDNLLSDVGERHEGFVRVARVFLERQRQHIEAEDERLFPVAMQYLSDEDWTEIERQADALEESLSTGTFAERFAALSREIVARERGEQARREKFEAVS